MKRYELRAVEYAKRFAKAWDYFGIATGAFMEGFKAQGDDAFDEVEYTPTDGQHQLSVASFETWKEEREKEDFKVSLQKQLPWYEFTDVRINEKDGTISFQGTAVKK